MMDKYLNIDKLVAEKVMGYEVTYKEGWNCIEAKGDNRRGYFSPSREISHAWKVVDKFDFFNIEKITGYGDYYKVNLSVSEIDGTYSDVEAQDENVSMAICKTALLSVGIEIN